MTGVRAYKAQSPSRKHNNLWPCKRPRSPQITTTVSTRKTSLSKSAPMRRQPKSSCSPITTFFSRLRSTLISDVFGAFCFCRDDDGGATFFKAIELERSLADVPEDRQLRGIRRHMCTQSQALALQGC